MSEEATTAGSGAFASELDGEAVSHMEIRCNGDLLACGLYASNDLAVAMSLRWLADLGPLAGVVADPAEAADHVEFERLANDQVAWWWREGDASLYTAIITDLRVGHLRLSIPDV